MRSSGAFSRPRQLKSTGISGSRKGMSRNRSSKAAPAGAMSGCGKDRTPAEAHTGGRPGLWPGQRPAVPPPALRPGPAGRDSCSWQSPRRPGARPPGRLPGAAPGPIPGPPPWRCRGRRCSFSMAFPRKAAREMAVCSSSTPAAARAGVLTQGEPGHQVRCNALFPQHGCQPGGEGHHAGLGISGLTQLLLRSLEAQGLQVEAHIRPVQDGPEGGIGFVQILSHPRVLTAPVRHTKNPASCLLPPHTSRVVRSTAWPWV